QIDNAATVHADAQEVIDVQRRFAEELFCTLLFQYKQPPLNGADRCGGDVAVFRRKLLGAIPDVLDKGPQVLQIEEWKIFIHPDAESDVENPLLNLVEFEH